MPCHADTLCLRISVSFYVVCHYVHVYTTQQPTVVQHFLALLYIENLYHTSPLHHTV